MNSERRADKATREVARVEGDPEVLKFSEECHRHALMAGWESQSVIGTEPVAVERPYRWSWAHVLRPMMVRAWDILDPVKAERRNLILVNPAFEPTCNATTHTLNAAIQGVLPGEIAPAHRHTAAALRFVIEGRGAVTVVNGEPCSMNPRDLILTPQWCWHDHANEGSEPLIWLDVLDVPFILGINQWFFETFAAKTQRRQRAQETQHTTDVVRPSVLGQSSQRRSLFIFPWEHVEPVLIERAKKLEARGSLISMEYTHPQTGGSVMPTIACHAHMLPPGGRARALRTTASAVLHVVQGHGASIVGGHELEWETGDVLALPHWTWVRHENHSRSDPAFLFSATDAPLLRMLGLLREENRPLSEDDLA